jgi:hypothetical protein
MKKACMTNYSYNSPAPNPDPKRWKLLDTWFYNNAYVLKVKYLDATNFEGVKIMVYKGKFPGYKNITSLDPHFTDDDLSPIARFRPDKEGIAMANNLAKNYKG